MDPADWLPGPESHGTERRCRELGGIRVAEVVMPAGLRLRRHTHASAQLVCVLEGSYSERWRRRRIRLCPGSVIFRPAGEPHANGFDGGEVLALVVSYSPARIAGLGSRRGPVELPAVLADLRGWVELELARHDGASATALEGLALLLLARVERLAEGRPQPVWLADACEFIERHHAEPISLTTVAASLGIQRATLAAAFRRTLDRSVGEAIRDARVRHAVAALGAVRKPLAEIALDCGFVDQAHMGRVVKRATGRTPGEVRGAGGIPARR